MDKSGENTATLEPLVARVLNEFSRGVELIERLPDSEYCASEGDVGGVGAHFRHNLDFVGSLLAGLATGRVDYSARERDIRIESDRRYAIEKIRKLTAGLKRLDREDASKEIFVRSELEQDSWHTSSLARELEFLHSHTVHHYALIVEKLKRSGLEVNREFGVAPSTLRFWRERGKTTAA